TRSDIYTPTPQRKSPHYRRVLTPCPPLPSGEGGLRADSEARVGELLPPQLSARQGHRDGEGARDSLRQLQVRAPAVRAVAGSARRGATGDRGRRTRDRGRRRDHVRRGLGPRGGYIL